MSDSARTCAGSDRGRIRSATNSARTCICGVRVSAREPTRSRAATRTSTGASAQRAHEANSTRLFARGRGKCARDGARRRRGGDALVGWTAAAQDGELRPQAGARRHRLCQRRRRSRSRPPLAPGAPSQRPFASFAHPFPVSWLPRPGARKSTRLARILRSAQCSPRDRPLLPRPSPLLRAQTAVQFCYPLGQAEPLGGTKSPGLAKRR